MQKKSLMTDRVKILSTDSTTNGRDFESELLDPMDSAYDPLEYTSDDFYQETNVAKFAERCRIPIEVSDIFVLEKLAFSIVRVNDSLQKFKMRLITEGFLTLKDTVRQLIGHRKNLMESI